MFCTLHPPLKFLGLLPDLRGTLGVPGVPPQPRAKQEGKDHRVLHQNPEHELHFLRRKFYDTRQPKYVSLEVSMRLSSCQFQLSKLFSFSLLSLFSPFVSSLFCPLPLAVRG